MAADAGSAIFKAIADFARLRRESRRTRDEMQGMADAAGDTDEALADLERQSGKTARELDRLRRDVERNSISVEKARLREADAAGKVRVAEEALAKVRRDGVQDTVRIAAAEEKLASAERNLADARQHTANRTQVLEAANRQLARAMGATERATDRNTSAFGRLSAALATVNRRMDEFKQSDASRQLDRMADAAGRFLRAGLKMLAVVSVLSLISAAVTAAVGPIVAAVGAISALSGAVGVLPGLLGAAAVGMGVLKLATSGMEDAMGALATGDLEKFNEAIKKMPPEMRGVLRVLWQLKPAFEDLKRSVQASFWSNMAKPIKQLATNYLPILKNTLTEAATAMNGLAREALAFFNQKRVVEDMHQAFHRIGKAFTGLKGVGEDVAAIFVDIFSVSTEFLPGMSKGIKKMTGDFREFIREARETGKLKQWIQTGIDAVKQLGRIFADVGSSIHLIFKAAEDSGHGFLDTVEKLTDRMAKFLKSAQGQDSLRKFFTAVGEAADVVWPILKQLVITIGDIVPVLTDIAEGVGPGVVDLLKGIGVAVKDARPGLVAMGKAFGDLLSAIGANGPLIGEIINGMATVVVPVLETIAALLQALAAWFNSLPEPVQKVVGQIGAFAVGAALAVAALGKIIKIGTGVIATIKTITSVAKSAAVALGLMQAASVTGGVVDGPDGKKGAPKPGVPVVIPDMSKAAGEAGEKAGRSWLTRFKGVLVGALKKLGWLGVALTVSEILGIDWGKEWKRFQDDIRTGWETGDVKKLIEAMPGFWSGMTGKIGQTMDSMAAGLSQDWAEIAAVATTSWNTLKAVVTGAGAGIRDGVAEKVSQLKSALSTAWADMQAKASGSMSALVTFFRGVGTNIKAGIVTRVTEMKTTLSTRWSEIQASATAKWNAVKTFFSTTLNAIKAGIVARVTEIRTAMGQKWEEVRATTAAKFTAVKERISTLLGQARDTASRIGSEVKARLTAWWEQVRSTTAAKFNAARDAASSAFARLKSAVTSRAAETRSALSNLAGYLGGAFRSAWSGVTGAVSSAMERMKSIVSGAVDAVIRALSRIGSAIAGAASSAASGLKAIIPGMQKGGWVGGRGRGDTQLRALDPREFVMNPKASAKYGPLLERLNEESGGRPRMPIPDPDQLIKNAASLARVSGGLATASRVTPSAPAPAAASGDGGSRSTTVNLAIYNPVPERASTSIHREAQKLAEFGIVRLADTTDRSRL